MLQGHAIVEVRVDGSPQESVTHGTEDVQTHIVTTNPSGVRILVDIPVSNGLHVRQKNCPSKACDRTDGGEFAQNGRSDGSDMRAD